MNGFISCFDNTSLKFPFRALSVSAIVFSFSGGLLAGLNSEISLRSFRITFQKQKIEFRGIQWLKGTATVKLAESNGDLAAPSISVLDPKPVSVQRFPAQAALQKSQFTQPRENLKRLKNAVEALETVNRDLYQDFQFAAHFHRGAFMKLDSSKLASESDWVWGNDLSIQVPAPRPRKEQARSESKFEPSQPRSSDVHPGQINLSPELSEKEKSDLASLLLGEQIKINSVAVRPDSTTPNERSVGAPLNPRPITIAQNQKRALEYSKASPWELAQIKPKEVEKPGKCGLGIEHPFSLPGNETPLEMDSQICPEKLTWISRSWNSTGWVKVEGARHMPTLTRHPAPSNIETLLMHEYHLADLFLKAGARLTKGMGIIVGKVPVGYKVDFAGRSEEPVYFESKGNKHFAILNVEPGAGVLELVSEKDQELNTTVFVPVLEDVVTFMALSEPEVRNIQVKVNKNTTREDQEIVGLTVGLSTQTGIQAITRSDGTALLSNVRTIKGYPLFVDIGSRQGQEAGYIYRYELIEPDSSGYFQVNQIAEKSLYRWLNQVKQGLSDQGALVVGAYQRTRIDGFREEYRTETRPLTSRFGLEPLNYSILWNGKISSQDPLEGDLPRFMSVQVSEGLSQVLLKGPNEEVLKSDLIPVSPRVIHVISP
ncbi:MAG: hypothetical protein KGP28_00280 [Bdellovibrionales bacterium]|nr:hypothetical protein [Bdellovibrionales bacterium]